MPSSSKDPSPPPDHQYARSIPARRREKKAKAPGRGGKPGNPGHFVGARAAFFDKQLPHFLLIKGAARKVQKPFWTRCFAEYWENFHWQLPLDADPDPDRWPPPAPVTKDTPQDVRDLKAEVESRTQKVSVKYTYLLRKHLTHCASAL